MLFQLSVLEYKVFFIYYSTRTHILLAIMKSYLVYKYGRPCSTSEYLASIIAIEKF